jgi:rubrerythrin
MDMFDFAIKMEQDAEQLYRDLAKKASTPGVKQIFNMLADDEKKHEQAIEILKAKSDGVGLDDTFIPEVTTVFENLRKHINDIDLSKEQLDDYRIALDIEKKGYAYFKEQFEKSKTTESKRFFKSIANQELYHIKTVENLIEMLERPKWWVENAEFTPSMDDYI